MVLVFNIKHFLGLVFNMEEILHTICKGEQNMLTAQGGGEVQGEQQQKEGKTLH